MQVDFRQEKELRGKRVPIVPLVPGWSILKILDAKTAIIGAQEREKLILTLKQESSELVTAHFMDMTKGHRWEFINLVEALLPIMEHESEKGVYDFEPGFLLDKKFECKVRITTGKAGDMRYNNLDDIRPHKVAGEAEEAEIPF